ncbi:hypothetical protein BSKO_06109 [Bryopsis sp. KO-2023]|nr:hypothetical protein BSKO_06109 [Bryopsis sp. KO-2023]
MRLPSAILANIFERFSSGSLVLTAACVCRQWREVANSPGIPWKRFYEKEFGGVVERIDEVRQAYTRECRWKAGELEQHVIEGISDTGDCVLSNVWGDSVCVAPTWDNSMQLWDLTSKELCWSLHFPEGDYNYDVHHNYVAYLENVVVLHMSEKHIAWGSRGSGIGIVDRKNGRWLHILHTGYQGFILSLHIHGDMVVGCFNTTGVRVWNLLSSKCVHHIESDHRTIATAADIDEKRIVMGFENLIKVWDRSSYDCVGSIPIQGVPRSMHLRGGLLCVLNRNITIWDVEKESCIKEIGDENLDRGGLGYCAFDGVKVLYRQPPLAKKLRNNRFRYDWSESDMVMHYVAQERSFRTLILPQNCTVFGVAISDENIVCGIKLYDKGSTVMQWSWRLSHQNHWN